MNVRKLLNKDVKRCRISEKKFRLFIQMGGITTNWLIWDPKNTLEAIIGRRSLLEGRPILTVLKASGVMLKPVGQTSVELGKNRFIFI